MTDCEFNKLLKKQTRERNKANRKLKERMERAQGPHKTLRFLKATSDISFLSLNYGGNHYIDLQLYHAENALNELEENPDAKLNHQPEEYIDLIFSYLNYKHGITKMTEKEKKKLWVMHEIINDALIEDHHNTSELKSVLKSYTYAPGLDDKFIEHLYNWDDSVNQTMLRHILVKNNAWCDMEGLHLREYEEK